MPVPEIIIQLVHKFKNNLDAYRAGTYNEAQLRQEFVNPLFAALGWDMNNTQGFAENYKEVIHEDSISVGTGTKAPDYCFRVGGTRKFFVEAKKPSIKLKEGLAPAFQLRRYAWSAKLPLSVLTNFEEFAVYDCRTKPTKTDNPAASRTLFITFEEYLTRWDEISGVFSKDAILKGAFDKYAETGRGKKGTAAVDDVFLNEIETWRELLARNIALRNPELTQHELNFSVQRTIDRLIFMRICEDRAIEHYGALQALLDGGSVYDRLVYMFHRADEKYNSGLFHFEFEKDRPESPDALTPELKIDDKLLKEIIRHLYYPDCPYEFSVFPSDILGQVYEQFLGKVIRLTAGHRAVVEEKPEVKKAGGVYYTPTYIVDHIIKSTVGNLVKHKTPKQVAALHILDPACGSGSFLIAAYQLLLDWHVDWYINHGAEKYVAGRKPALYKSQAGEWKLTTAERKRILLNNIYGVDIDSQAVEVTKLSLLLKVLEGENEQTISSQLKLFHERALPDLGNNIKCGNSLIGSDFYRNKLMGMFPDEEKYRTNVFDWDGEHGFKEIMNKGGFDAVVGNPPYGALLTEDETNYLNGTFVLQNYQLDTYLLFIEKCLKIINRRALLGFIMPNTWLQNLQTNKFREYIFNHTSIEEIVHFLFKVFAKATVDTEIVILRKSNPSSKHDIKISIADKSTEPPKKHVIKQERWKSGNGAPVNIFEKNEYSTLIEKLEKYPVLDDLLVVTVGTKPFQVGKGKPPQTHKIVNEKPYVSENKVDSTFRPLLRGSLIQKYAITWRNDYWISFGDWLAEPRYSANYDAPEKIVIRRTGDSLVATLDAQQFIVQNSLWTIIGRRDNINLKYCLGLLNSKLLNWIHQTVINPEKGEALAEVKGGHLAKLPIALIDTVDFKNKSSHDHIVSLVEQMLELNKQLPKAKTEQDKTVIQRQIEGTNTEIDKLVYELYELTDEEIKVVEG